MTKIFKQTPNKIVGIIQNNNEINLFKTYHFKNINQIILHNEYIKAHCLFDLSYRQDIIKVENNTIYYQFFTTKTKPSNEVILKALNTFKQINICKYQYINWKLPNLSFINTKITDLTIFKALNLQIDLIDLYPIQPVISFVHGDFRKQNLWMQNNQLILVDNELNTFGYFGYDLIFYCIDANDFNLLEMFLKQENDVLVLKTLNACILAWIIKCWIKQNFHLSEILKKYYYTIKERIRIYEKI